jgi:uncharacterized membrane protein YcaP (DUF421 family)
MENIWFDSWDSILRVICIIPFAYFAMVLLLRVSGKRTLSKMNAFDFVVTIALGSTLASVALNQNIPLANGVTAFILFIGFQFLFTWLSVRVKTIKILITSRPSLIYYKGSFLHQAMKKERITVEEVYSAARKKGISSMNEIEMIIFETTGDIAIIKKIMSGNENTFDDVRVEVRG